MKQTVNKKAIEAFDNHIHSQFGVGNEGEIISNELTQEQFVNLCSNLKFKNDINITKSGPTTTSTTQEQHYPVLVNSTEKYSDGASNIDWAYLTQRSNSYTKYDVTIQHSGNYVLDYMYAVAIYKNEQSLKSSTEDYGQHSAKQIYLNEGDVVTVYVNEISYVPTYTNEQVSAINTGSFWCDDGISVTTKTTTSTITLQTVETIIDE